MLTINVWRNVANYVDQQEPEMVYEVDDIQESVCGGVLLVMEKSNILLPPSVVIEILKG